MNPRPCRPSRNGFLSLIGAALALAFATTHPAAAGTIPGGRFDEVHLSEPTGAMRGFLVLFSAASGWTEADQASADRLTREGVVVMGVDTARYAASLADIKEDCHHVVGDIENLSHQLQRERQSQSYFIPIVAGFGEGGTLAEKILETAGSNTIAGAVSVDPAATLDPRFDPCPPDPTILHDAGLPGFWAIGATADLPPETLALAARLRQAGAKVKLADADRSSTAPEILLALTRPHVGSHPPAEKDVSDLPLVELPAEHPAGMLAIVISGDGGWRDLDKTIASTLSGWGVSVVGWDSLRYFWGAKTPEQTSRDLARVMQYYGARWHAPHIALIGYSFGADVLPFAYQRLPEKLRAKVSLISLLGFARGADFEVRVTGWLGLPASRTALPAMPEIAKVPPSLVQCIYGAEETDTLCPGLAGSGAEVVRIPGDHHFGRNYTELSRIILQGWKQRLASG